MGIILRELRLPEDYKGLAALLNTHWSEPVTSERLEEDDRKLYTTGHTYRDEEGRLAGYDRTRIVAATEDGLIAGYVWGWRAPWTERGHLNHTIVVAEPFRKQGIGSRLLEHALQWGTLLGADTFVTTIWDDEEDSLRFARRAGLDIDTHAFQSVLEISAADPKWLEQDVYNPDIRYATYAELQQDGASEQKLYELYKETLVDIPGFTGEVPVLEEWRKWHLMVEGYAPERVIVAVDGDRFVGVTNVLHNLQTNGMYHEFTGVSRPYRGRKIAQDLKIQAVRLAVNNQAAYIKTDNDSANAPILSVNRRLGYKALRGTYRMAGKFGEMKGSARSE
ncbi:GNAT family N-acetyltransferase [Paenibacillus protaetiae]|uniref:GNAT family N-acetyltransferase n=1 Tax=Paenibacillus protaetiae TaxID=2509456 RepID=A0A4P6EW61_9BACL|nr:GNAT family N-acetyltransferase [Paenibacillus protaetiae]QAY65949.1 GNAT family N-acetyltransferase [Paenibacillus protaetiae]